MSPQKTIANVKCFVLCIEFCVIWATLDYAVSAARFSRSRTSTLGRGMRDRTKINACIYPRLEDQQPTSVPTLVHLQLSTKACETAKKTRLGFIENTRWVP